MHSIKNVLCLRIHTFKSSVPLELRHSVSSQVQQYYNIESLFCVHTLPLGGCVGEVLFVSLLKVESEFCTCVCVRACRCIPQNPTAKSMLRFCIYGAGVQADDAPACAPCRYTVSGVRVGQCGCKLFLLGFDLLLCGTLTLHSGFIIYHV